MKSGKQSMASLISKGKVDVVAAVVMAASFWFYLDGRSIYAQNK